MADSANGILLGIDLGTTNSVMAYLDPQGTPITIRNSEGELTTPSVVLFDRRGRVVVGREARLAALTQPGSAAEFVKREMGEKFYSRPINGKRLSPQAIQALILKKLKQDAQAKVGPVAGAVITVPAYFDEARRQATVAAGQIAGLHILDIFNEPTAAALAYAFRDFLEHGFGADEALQMAEGVYVPNISMVYDLGGGTFDVTVLKTAGRKLTVLATDGDVRLGGHDWDERLVNFAAEQFIRQHRMDPRDDPLSYQNLYLEAEEAKKVLSTAPRTRLAIKHGGRRTEVELTRQKFEEMTAELLYRTERRMTHVLEQARLNWGKISAVLAVGGSTRMPQVGDMVERVSGKAPNRSLSPDEVVAHGAAIHAAMCAVRPQKAWKATVLPQAVPADMGGAAATLEPVAERSGHDTGISPADLEEPAGIDDLVLLEPAAEVAAGPAAPDEAAAAEQFDNELTQVLQAIQTVNVNSHSLGVIMKLDDGRRINSIIIPRNTPLPTSVTRRYGTVVDNQTSVTVRVVEGEAELADDCIQLGECQIQPLPWGLPRGSTIYVTFSYDPSGRLNVKATEATSGNAATTTIHRPVIMPPVEIARVKDAVAKMEIR